MSTTDQQSPRKSATRRALIAAAARLFETHGFDAVTTEEIAEAAGVSQRTFFRHFPSKEAVVFGDQEALLDGLDQALKRRPAGEPVLASVREALVELAREHEGDRDIHLDRFRLSLTAPSVAAHGRAVVQAAWEDLIATAVAERLGVDRERDLRPHLVASACVGAIGAAILRWIAIDGSEPLDRLAEEALDLLDAAFGLDAPAGTPGHACNSRSLPD